MPAAAVIPAPIAYIKVVAVKKLVVGFRSLLAGRSKGFVLVAGLFLLKTASVLNWTVVWIQIVYFEKIRVFKAGHCLEYISME